MRGIKATKEAPLAALVPRTIAVIALPTQKHSRKLAGKMKRAAPGASLRDWGDYTQDQENYNP